MSFDETRAAIEELNSRIGGFPPDWGDLENLYNLVMERKPRFLVEFGSGFSTIVLFRAMGDLGRGFVFSLESDPTFYMLMGSFLPKWTNLNMATDMSAQEVCNYYLFSALHTISADEVEYSYLPIPYAEFVYVDGPALVGKQRLLKNIWDLFPLPKTILVDGRPAQCREIHSRVGAFYDMDRDDENCRTTFRMREEFESSLLHVDPGKAWYQKEGW